MNLCGLSRKSREISNVLIVTSLKNVVNTPVRGVMIVIESGSITQTDTDSPSRTGRKLSGENKGWRTTVKSDLNGFSRIDRDGRCFLVRVRSAQSGYQQVSHMEESHEEDCRSLANAVCIRCIC